MILVGIDLGSNQLPWAIQEPQITSQELRGEKEPGLILCSCPRRYVSVIKVEIVRRRKRKAIQSKAENGSRKVSRAFRLRKNEENPLKISKRRKEDEKKVKREKEKEVTRGHNIVADGWSNFASFDRFY